METYFIDQVMARKPKLIIKLNGEYVDLKGKDSVEKLPATPKRPAVEVNIRAATQQDLQLLRENPDVYGDFSRIIHKREVVNKLEQLKPVNNAQK